MVTRLRDNRSIEELAIEAQEAPEPGTLPSSIDIDEGTTGVIEHAGAGWRYVWDTLTGERSRIPRDLLLNTLKKKRPDGSRVFTTDPAGLPTPRRGTLPCLLHPEHPDREYHDTLGLPTCDKKLMTALDVRRHTQHRHKNEWDSIQEDRKLQLEAEEREVRRSIIANAAPKATPEPQPAAAPVPHAGAAVSFNGEIFSAAGKVTKLVAEDCPDCGETLTAKNRGGINLKLKAHRSKCKGQE